MHITLKVPNIDVDIMKKHTSGGGNERVGGALAGGQITFIKTRSIMKRNVAGYEVAKMTY